VVVKLTPTQKLFFFFHTSPTRTLVYSSKHPRFCLDDARRQNRQLQPYGDAKPAGVVQQPSEHPPLSYDAASFLVQALLFCSCGRASAVASRHLTRQKRCHRPISQSSAMHPLTSSLHRRPCLPRWLWACGEHTKVASFLLGLLGLQKLTNGCLYCFSIAHPAEYLVRNTRTTQDCDNTAFMTQERSLSSLPSQHCPARHQSDRIMHPSTHLSVHPFVLDSPPAQPSQL